MTGGGAGPGVTDKPPYDPLRAATDGRPARRPLYRTVEFEGVELVAVLMILGFVAQWFLPDGPRFAGLSSEALREGRVHTLPGHMWVHGGAGHLLMNLTALGAFGPVVAARFPAHRTGRLILLAAFVVLGLAGGLAFLVAHPGGATPVVGASGAICGLWGAAARLAHRSSGLHPLQSRFALRQIAAFAISNLVLVALSLVLTRLVVGRGLVLIAWEAHLGGFLAGLLWLAPLVARRYRSVAVPLEEGPR
jgi:membrane associated rhomboid family serine protease